MNYLDSFFGKKVLALNAVFFGTETNARNEHAKISSLEQLRQK